MLGRRYPTSMGFRIRWRDARRITSDLVARAGLEIDVRTPVGELGVADRTRLAIARALPDREDDKVVLVLDEPTAALPDTGRRATLRHHPPTRRRPATASSSSPTTWMRSSISPTPSRSCATGRRSRQPHASGIDHEALTRLIVGHDIERSTGREEALQVAGPAVLTTRSCRGGSVADVSAVVHQGEIVGVAGLSGSGREILASLITGRLSRTGSGAGRRCPCPAGESECCPRRPFGVRAGRTSPLRHLPQPQRPPESHHGVAPASSPVGPYRRRRRAR